MAYTAGALHRNPAAVGASPYYYDAGSDTMLTVLTDGYFNNRDDGLNFAAEDRIYVKAADGICWAEVVSVNATTYDVATRYAGGDLPLRSPATGTEAALSAAMVPGHYELGTSLSTASRYVLGTPYPGARYGFTKVDSGTATFEIDAGGSGATAITFDGSNRRAIMRAECDTLHVVGVSATRWRILNHQFSASAVSEGGSVRLPGT